MPALVVSLNGDPLASVATDDCDVLSVHVSGTRIDPTLGRLGVSGGSYRRPGESIHLIWVNELTLASGQALVVSLVERGETSHRGLTIEELFPDDGSAADDEFEATDAMFEELATRPQFHSAFDFRFVSASGTHYAGCSGPGEHGFLFSVLWNSFHPERARVTLDTYTLEQVRSRSGGRYHVEDMVHLGGSVHFEVVSGPGSP